MFGVLALLHLVQSKLRGTFPRLFAAHFGVFVPAGLLARRLLGYDSSLMFCCPHRGFRACSSASASPAARQLLTDRFYSARECYDV